MAVADIFKQAVRERFAEFKSRLDDLISAFGNPSKVDLKTPCQKLNEAARNLVAILPSDHHPNWIPPILQATANYVSSTHAQTGKDLLRTIMLNHARIVPLQFVDETESLDFDDLYAELRSTSELPDLFDRLIKLTSELIESGEIDNIHVLRGLEHLKGVLNANRNGSFAADRQTSFIAVTLRNLEFSYLKSIPGIGPAVEAWGATVDQLDTTSWGLAVDLGKEAVGKLLGGATIAKLKQLPGAKSTIVSSTVTPLLSGPPNSDGELGEATNDASQA